MSSKNNNKINVPEARAAMDKFKMEAAAEVGVNLKQGYNGDLTSRRGRLRGRPDGQEDDRVLREEPVSVCAEGTSLEKGRADGCPLFLFFTGYAIIPRYLLVLIFGKETVRGRDSYGKYPSGTS